MSFEPSEKSKEVETALKAMFGFDRLKNIIEGVCVFCNESVDEDSFRDSISKKEFTISGICQKCQDNVFG